MIHADDIDVSVIVTPPVPDPTNLIVSPGNRLIRISWTKDPSPNLTDQILSVSSNGGMSYYLSMSVGVGENWSVGGLINNVVYTFKIVSIDHIGRQSIPGATIEGSPRDSSPPPSSPICGNFVVESGEECDDGNGANGDGCDDNCQNEPFCGDWNLDPGEECDDGNNIDDDGCDRQCDLEPICGDGIQHGHEECDDGNVLDGDGCNAICEIEHLISITVCGNGFLEATEECDDGNVFDADGCSSVCLFEQLATNIIQPIPDTVNVPQMDLDFDLIDPFGTFDYVKLYFSKNGDPYIQLPGTYTNDPISMTNLEEGVYNVYSIGVDSGGNEELAPATFDASFMIDMIPTINLVAHPEKRMPPENNWSVEASLKIYPVGEVTPDYNLPINTDDAGMALVDNIIAPGTYHVAFKGRSHLTKIIRDVTFDLNRDVNLDFTFENSFDLIAGDVHPSKDDEVNSMDISATLLVLNMADDDADFNMDGEVNAVDLSIEIVNLNKVGDTP